MKKVLLLAVMLVIGSQLFAFTTQGVWRWRNNDGTETSATWRAPQNTPIMISSVDSTLRLRIEMYNNGSGGLLDGALFEDSSNEEGGHWDTIKLEANTNAFVLAGTNEFVNDLEPTTAQLTGQAFTFEPGKVVVSTDRLPAQTVSRGARTEIEYVFKPSANIKPGVTYYFRVDAATYLIDYEFPSLTTSSTLPVNITGFVVQADGKGVLVRWTTVSEINNDRFEVERSPDGRNWSVISSTKGNGTSSEAHTYTVHDNNPLNGMNFYRIKQYDNNGKMSITGIKSLRVRNDRAAVVSVLPNPARGNNINFSLQRFAGGNLAVTLSAANGKTVHTEVIKAAQQGIKYNLHVSNALQSGMYLLHVKGGDVDEVVKVLVQ
jgi:hypothetical protein